MPDIGYYIDRVNRVHSWARGGAITKRAGGEISPCAVRMGLAVRVPGGRFFNRSKEQAGASASHF